MATTKVKKKKQRKPNVYARSYQQVDASHVLVDSSQPTKGLSKRERLFLTRGQLYVNTLPRELKRFGIIAGGVLGVLGVLAVVLNLI